MITLPSMKNTLYSFRTRYSGLSPPYPQNHGDVIICEATHSLLWCIMIMYKLKINDPPGWYLGTAANKHCSVPNRM